MKIYKTLFFTAAFIGSNSIGWTSDHIDEAEPVFKKHAKGMLPTKQETIAHLQAKKPLKSTHISLAGKTLPKFVDNTMYASSRMNQGSLGSCTANAIGEQMYMRQVIQAYDKSKGRKTLDYIKNKIETASRLFIYFNERNIEGSIMEDAGASIGDGMRTMFEIGAPAERYWTYDDSTTSDDTDALPKFMQKPSDEAYAHAAENKDMDGLDHDLISPAHGKYDLNEIKQSLVLRQPLVAGIEIFESFETPAVAKTGLVPLPKKREKLEGGHAIVIAGYDDAKSYFICINSWGTDWGGKDAKGIGGLFFLPYAFVQNAGWTSELWKIGTVTTPTITLRMNPSAHHDNNNNNNNDNNAPLLEDGDKKHDDKKVEIIE